MNVVVRGSKIQGKGVYANKDFDEGEIILDIDDSHEVADTSKLTQRQHDYDCDYLSNGKIVLMQPPEKYINHCCDPNAYTKTINGIRKVLAMRGISKGEEITFDYSVNGYNDGTFKCNCGSKSCRRTYQGNFFKLPIDIQLRYVPYLEGWFVAEHRDEVQELLKLRAPAAE